MTRLKSSDICDIALRLEKYDQQLLKITGRTLVGIACHACNVDERTVRQKSPSFLIDVIPVTSGQGIITDFSKTVASILKFSGFNARVSDTHDTAGIVQAYENRSDAVMMADDKRFVGINLNNRCVADNSEVTGRVFAAALDLMAKGIKDRDALVMGCGPVGKAAAIALLSFNARVVLYDNRPEPARILQKSLSALAPENQVRIEEDLEKALLDCQYIIEATPVQNTIPEKLISGRMGIAAPGVPLGVSSKGCGILKDRLVHDKLELGVTAMAVSILTQKEETRS